MTTDWVTIVVTFVGGGLLGTIITAWRGGASEYYADVRHLRDLQAERVRAAFKPLLAIARVLSDVARELNFPLQPANTEARDKLINDSLTTVMAEYLTARIALQLEPRISKQIDPLFEGAQRAYQVFRNSYQMRGEMRAKGVDGGPTLSAENIDAQAKTVIETVDALHAAMLSLLERLDEPAQKPWYVRDSLTA